MSQPADIDMKFENALKYHIIIANTSVDCFGNYSHHRHTYDANRRIWVFDDLFKATWIFFFGIHILYCNSCYGVDHNNARIPSHG